MTISSTEHHTMFNNIPFLILSDGNDTAAPIWNVESFTSTQHVAGSNRNDTFLAGLGPMRVTYTVQFTSIADYWEMMDNIQNTGTLRQTINICMQPTREVDYFGKIYGEIDDVTLLDLSASIIYVNGDVLASMTFERESLLS